MRSIIIALTLAASAFLPAVAGAECLPSSEAVFAAHPGARHASWEGRSHHGRRCWFEDGERHTKLAARSPVPRQRTRSAPPIRTISPEETAPRWPTTTEAAPPPIPCNSIGDTDFCAAARAYVVANADELDKHRRESIGTNIAVIEDYLARETVR